MITTTIYKNGVEIDNVITCDETNYTALYNYLDELGLSTDNMDEWDENEWYCKVDNDMYSTY